MGQSSSHNQIEITNDFDETLIDDQEAFYDPLIYTFDKTWEEYNKIKTEKLIVMTYVDVEMPSKDYLDVTFHS